MHAQTQSVPLRMGSGLEKSRELLPVINCHNAGSFLNEDPNSTHHH